MSVHRQQTLDGREAAAIRLADCRPDTLVYCPDCQEHILRSERATHEHDLYDGIDERRDSLMAVDRRDMFLSWWSP